MSEKLPQALRLSEDSPLLLRLYGLSWAWFPLLLSLGFAIAAVVAVVRAETGEVPGFLWSGVGMAAVIACVNLAYFLWYTRSVVRDVRVEGTHVCWVSEKGRTEIALADVMWAYDDNLEPAYIGPLPSQLTYRDADRKVVRVVFWPRHDRAFARYGLGKPEAALTAMARRAAATHPAR